MQNSPFGELSFASLRGDPATSWFALGYNRHRGVLAEKPDFAGMEILAFIGTWCPDCQEHFPGFARILATASFPAEHFHLYNLDRSKSFPGGAGLIARHKITRLPTFVFLKEGKEAGRITETPKHSLLEDMAEIFKPKFPTQTA